MSDSVVFVGNAYGEECLLTWNSEGECFSKSLSDNEEWKRDACFDLPTYELRVTLFVRDFRFYEAEMLLELDDGSGFGPILVRVEDATVPDTLRRLIVVSSADGPRVQLVPLYEETLDGGVLWQVVEMEATR